MTTTHDFSHTHSAQKRSRYRSELNVLRAKLESAGRSRGSLWTPELAHDPARGPVLWTLLGICLASAGLIVHRWAAGREVDLVVGAVLLATTTWMAALLASRGRVGGALMALTPYVVAALGLVTLGVMQTTADPGDLAHTNALLGAYLALPVAYMLFFLLRPPSEALAGAIAACLAVVILQATLPPLFVGRHTSGPWTAVLTGSWHGAVILLLFTIPRLRSDRDLLHAVMRSSRDAMVLLVPQRRRSPGSLSGAAVASFRVAFANGPAERIFDIERQEDLATGGPLGAAWELHERLAEAANRQTEVTLNATLPTLEGLRWFRVAAAPFRGGVAATFIDITEHKETEGRALALALTDPLTGVANRRGFELEAARRLVDAEAHGRSLTLCYIDLDGFKSVNDNYGHEAGDALLKGVAERLGAAVRGSDHVARLGGDEFAILAEGLEGGAVEAFFERVHLSFEAPFDVAGRELPIRASFGVVTHARELVSALATADAAMYSAKQRGGGVAIVRDGE